MNIWHVYVLEEVHEEENLLDLKTILCSLVKKRFLRV